jgi:hypothetical protein
MKCFALSAAAATALLVVGCAGPGTMPVTTLPPAAPPAAEPAAPFVEGAILPAQGSVRGEDLSPTRSPEERRLVVAGDRIGSTLVTTTAASDAYGGTQRSVTPDVETVYWRLGDDGSVGLLAVDAQADRTTSVFAEPLLLAPPELAAGDARTVEVPMRAVFTERPASERDRGTGTRSVRYAHDQMISLAGREIRAKTVEVEFTADLRTAKAVKRSTLWVVPGEGIVAERWERRLVILAVIEQRSGQTLVRLVGGESGSATAPK